MARGRCTRPGLEYGYCLSCTLQMYARSFECRRDPAPVSHAAAIGHIRNSAREAGLCM
jgi:hypothetical protein